MTINKTISINEDLDRYIKDSHISLSKFVQDKLKEEIITNGKADQYNISQKK